MAYDGRLGIKMCRHMCAGTRVQESGIPPTKTRHNHKIWNREFSQCHTLSSSVSVMSYDPKWNSSMVKRSMACEPCFTIDGCRIMSAATFSATGFLGVSSLISPLERFTCIHIDSNTTLCVLALLRGSAGAAYLTEITILKIQGQSSDITMKNNRRTTNAAISRFTANHDIGDLFWYRSPPAETISPYPFPRCTFEPPNQ